MRAVEPTPLPAAPTVNPGTVAAVCHRCGAEKRGPLVPCKSCVFTPLGEDRAVAWLFSSHHLDADELIEVARRVSLGERPEPSRALRDLAREAMGAAPIGTDHRKPLTHSQVAWLVAGNLLLTPLVGLSVWFGLGADRPIAARQALRWTLPMMVMFVGGWVLLLLSRV
jgi:hypothetical protein